MTFNKKLIVRTISTILLAEVMAMLPSLMLAFSDGDLGVAKGFIITMAILGILGLVGIKASKEYKSKIKVRESYFVVLVCWLTVIVSGLLPYLLSGEGYSIADSIFESVASWTTSSAWVIDASTMPRALVLWRGVASWLGGMGVILIAIMVLSTLGVSGQKLINAELPGPTIMKTSARMRDTIKSTYIIYSIMTLTEFLLLMAGRLPFFVALINTLTSVSTAGIIDYQGAIQHHFTPYVKVVLGIFSLLSSVNFALLIGLSKKNFKKLWEDYELRIYTFTIAVSGTIIAIIIRLSGVRGSSIRSIVDAFAGVISFASTSGFPLERVMHWPNSCKGILLVLMIIGSCAGSTGGGIKVIRLAVFLKIIRRGLYKRIHPNASKPIMLRNHPVEAENVSSISTFILLFLGVYLLGTLLLSVDNLDMETTLSAPIALLTNTGVGFGRVAFADYRCFSAFGRIVGSFMMMAGRLELYAILIVFSRSFWNSDRSR